MSRAFIQQLFTWLMLSIGYNDDVKKAIVTESKPKIKRKGIVAKSESSNHKHSKNYRKVNKGQGKCSKSRKSNG